MTDAQVEAVAIAIREHVANRSGRGGPWDKLPEKAREEWLNEARVAIRAVEQLHLTEEERAAYQRSVAR